MDVNDRGGDRSEGGEKRDSTLGQSQPHKAQHATHQCQTVLKWTKKRYARMRMSKQSVQV